MHIQEHTRYAHVVHKAAIPGRGRPLRAAVPLDSFAVLQLVRVMLGESFLDYPLLPLSNAARLESDYDDFGTSFAQPGDMWIEARRRWGCA